MSKDDAKQAVFGAADGLCATLGVVLALVVTGHTEGALLGGVAVALSECIGMGTSEWLSDSTNSIHRAFIMGLATMIGSLLAVFPLLIGLPPLSSIGTALIGGLIISYLRPEGHWRSLLHTFGVLIPATLIAVLITVLI